MTPVIGNNICLNGEPILVALRTCFAFVTDVRSLMLNELLAAAKLHLDRFKLNWVRLSDRSWRLSCISESNMS
jgi:hypothetical protein